MITGAQVADGLPAWSTAAFGELPGITALEMRALSDHLRHCRRSKGRFFGLHGAAQTMHRFVASRFVTTVLLTGLLIGLGCLV